MAVDYGFFEALTGPLKAAGQIQAQRDQQKMQQFQMMQQQRQIELAQLEKQKGIQDMLTQSQEAAKMDLYTKSNFSIHLKILQIFFSHYLQIYTLPPQAYKVKYL